MSGQLTALAAPPMVDGGNAHVRVGSKPLSLLDARPPTRPFGPEQQREALEKLERKAGPATAAIEGAVSLAFDALRAELNQLAGGQASARVMIMVRNAELTQLAAELQASISRGAHGGYVESADEGQTEKGLRSLAGICAVANDLLSKATEAAREEGKAAKGSATDQLFGRIGVGQGRPGADVGPGGVVESPARPPLDPGGTFVLGPPSPQSAPSKKEPK